LPPGGVWADLGSGEGAFTLALRELVGPAAEIFAVDQHQASLAELVKAYQRKFGNADRLQTLRADFRKLLDLPALDGLLMANSLHFIKDKIKILKHLKKYLTPRGMLLVVEYNVDKGNPWVPYPFSFGAFRSLALEAGFSAPRLLATHPSSFLREFYSASAQPAPVV
jgi:ubiquinone/menaquinone biosynthesis C-methylase UbiE